MPAAREPLRSTGVELEALEAWVEAGWLVRHRDGEPERFTEIDLARARMIRDLREDMGVNDEGIGVILDLVDQIHGLRHTLRQLLTAIDARSEAIRRRMSVPSAGAR